METTYVVIALAVALAAAWYLRGVWEAKKPTTRETGLKLALKGVAMLSNLESTTPQDVAAMAAKQAHEAALMTQFKEAAAKLT